MGLDPVIGSGGLGARTWGLLLHSPFVGQLDWEEVEALAQDKNFLCLGPQDRWGWGGLLEVKCTGCVSLAGRSTSNLGPRLRPEAKARRRYCNVGRRARNLMSLHSSLGTG